MKLLSQKGQQCLAEWDDAVLSKEREKELELIFKEQLAKGYVAANVTDEADEIINKFSVKESVVFLPQIAGGCTYGAIISL